MTSGREVLIVGSAPASGAESFYADTVRAAGTLIAADAGLELCLASGRVPDVCVGDFDSVSPKALRDAERAGASVRRFPAEKDESDLDLALGVARELGASRVVFTAAFAERPDHTLASLGTLLSAADLSGVAKEPGWTAYALSSRTRATLTLAESPATLVSIMAVGTPVTVSSAGLQYPLEHLTLQPLSSRGLSNVCVDTTQEIVLHEGVALVLVIR
jgi:thiamine pyrophosphokinase